MQIRPIHQHDIPAMLLIEEAVHLSPWNKKAFFMCLQPHCLTYVAIINEHATNKRDLIGFVILSHHAEECHVLNLAVAARYQHQGIGKTLLAHALKEAQETHHVKAAYLEVRRSNTRAIHLYQQFGFVQIGERKNYYKDPGTQEDALIFAKLLLPTS